MGEQRLSLPGLVTQLLHDGVDLGRAELRLGKANLFARIAAAKSGIILFVAAAVVALLALIALTIGLMLALATLVGFGMAALIVFFVLIIIAAALGWIGAKQLSTRPAAIVERVG